MLGNVLCLCILSVMDGGPLSPPEC
uniref:Uncharacterized protein n=1 Tax=Anguilla anguilla TaxID=7936 RepID=A0A0E9Q535_ANGAN